MSPTAMMALTKRMKSFGFIGFFGGVGDGAQLLFGAPDSGFAGTTESGAVAVERSEPRNDSLFEFEEEFSDI